MLDELTYAKKMLQLGGYTLVVCGEGNVFVSEDRGIRPLLSLIGEEQWIGACAADQIVGKAAAMLYVLLGVKAVYAEVLSESARAVLQANGIVYDCHTLTEQIINREGSGICPMERAVAALEHPADAPAAIHSALEALKKG